MAGLALFICFCCATAAGILIFARQLRHLARFGIGGSEEDLSKARRVMIRLGVLGAMTLAAGVGAIFCGVHWSSVWRQSIGGQMALNGLIVLAFCGSFLAWGYTLHQQWSRRGSVRGMMKGGVLFTLFVGLGMLAIAWRWGL